MSNTTENVGTKTGHMVVYGAVYAEYHIAADIMFVGNTLCWYDSYSL